jgi:metal-dependent amidase/aminoacylase/carboxypeptidase family protein
MVEEDFVMVEHTDIPNVAASKDYLKVIDEHIESLSDDLRHISLSIHDNPELQFKEYHAHRVLTEYLKKQDWKVTPSAYGIETAFVAVYETGKKGPVVSFNAEYGRPLSYEGRRY